MLERQLTSELHRVADAVPVPEDLFPVAKLTRGGARRPWAMVAAAAVVLVALGFSPLGQKAVDAATQWVMTYRVQVSGGTHPGTGVNQLTIQIGETVEEKHDDGLREVYRGVTVANLTGWPLPTYLGPDPTIKAVLSDAYLEGLDTVWATTMYVHYEVPGFAGKFIAYHALRGGVTAAELEKIRSGKRPGIQVYGLDDGQIKQQTVTIKGHEATATLVDETWILQWWYEGGAGQLSSTLPLEELLKVAESLPSLE